MCWCGPRGGRWSPRAAPFPRVTVGGTLFTIAQANNALVFPGLGLGVVVAQATRITDSMIVAAADAVARLF